MDLKEFTNIHHESIERFKEIMIMYAEHIGEELPDLFIIQHIKPDDGEFYINYGAYETSGEDDDEVLFFNPNKSFQMPIKFLDKKYRDGVISNTIKLKELKDIYRTSLFEKSRVQGDLEYLKELKEEIQWYCHKHEIDPSNEFLYKNIKFRIQNTEKLLETKSKECSDINDEIKSLES